MMQCVHMFYFRNELGQLGDIEGNLIERYIVLLNERHINPTDGIATSHPHSPGPHVLTGMK